MKKNFSVNIGGRIFNIDDDAYECLNSYLARLRNFFAGDPGYQEIIADIEMRIAELLNQQKENGQPIINLKHIEDVIANMGEPDQLSDSESEHHKPAVGIKTRGKLYRDPDNRQIGGVAAGIAAWFDIDPVWVRVFFAAFTLFYGVGIIVYGVLWLILPVAQTTSEKLEMQRQSININTLRNELASAGSGIQKTGSSILHSIGTFIRFVTEVIARVFAFLFHLLGRLTGLALLLGVIAIFIGLSAASLVREPMNMGNYQLNTTTMVHALQWFIPGPDVRWLIYISAILLLVAVTGLLIYIGLRLLLKWPPFRWQIITVFVLIIVAGIITAVGAVFQYSRSTEKAASLTIRQSIVMKKKHIHIASGPNDFHQYFMPLAGDTIPGSMAYALSDINLSVRPVPADSLFITLIQSATAWQETQARGYAEKIAYHYKMQDTLVTLNPFFMFPQIDGMRYQKIDVIVGIPINTEVAIDENLRWNIRNGSDFIDYDRDGSKYIMTTAGLKRLDIPVAESDSVVESQNQ
jgi:phage shock protein PspC (stress-responsive transcriptional regulator)